MNRDDVIKIIDGKIFYYSDYINFLYEQLQLRDEIIKEVREYIEKHRHKPSENLIQTCENFIKEQEYLLSILDKEKE